jgi:multiple sugar transport system ATP-binding protein
MNLIEGSLLRNGQEWDFQYGKFKSEIQPDNDAQPEEGKIILGVRPEDVEISTDQGKGIPVKVLTIELMGQNYLILMQIDENLTVTSLVKSVDDFKDGDMVHISFTPGKIHLFDSETGTRV